MSQEPLQNTIDHVEWKKERALELNSIVKTLQEEVSKDKESVVVDDHKDSDVVTVAARMSAVTNGMRGLAMFDRGSDEVEYDLEEQLFKKKVVFRTDI